MSPRSFGIEAITDEDRAYCGSRFSDVREALSANPYQRTWGAEGEPPPPVHPVTLSSLLYGILPFGPPYAFRQATERAVDSAADLRWVSSESKFKRISWRSSYLQRTLQEPKQMHYIARWIAIAMEHCVGL